MNDRKRRILSLLAAAVGIGLMLSAATYASTPHVARSVLETVREASDGQLVDSLLDQCRKKPRWKHVWDDTRSQMV